VREDQSFDYESPQRYTACLGEWQQSVKAATNIFKDQMDRERLKKLLCEKDLIQQYLKEKVFARVQITQQEVEEYFKANLSEFNQPERVVLRQIHLNDEKLARQLRPRLNKANFAKMAEENSISPESAQGGLIRPFSRGELPGVFDYAFSMKIGEISDVLQSPYGFHIFLIETKEKELVATLESAEPKIRLLLLQRKQEEEYDLWVNMATKRISIVPAAAAL
jgi:parvulin-like peptidyl-prolyl isomerase